MRLGSFRVLRLLALPLFLLVTGSATSQTYSLQPGDAQERALRSLGRVELTRTPRLLLTDHRRLDVALGALQPQRPGVVDAYVVVAALDSDPVFGREAREAARVLARRYDAAGRTIVLTDDENPREAVASPANLALALARVAELMDTREDAVVVYTTSHGSASMGLAYRDAARGVGAIPPERLEAMFKDVGIANRMVILSACYSGVFVPRLKSRTAVVVTAAAANRSSFGCGAGNDWTYFGDAFLNRALRKAQPLAAALDEGAATVARWETAEKLTPSKPQVSIGSDVQRWLGPLEARMPTEASAPVGRSPAGGGGQ